jgi:hypothetical protein
MVNKIEGLFQTLYKYFSKSPKRHLEFTKLAEVMELKGMKDVKTHWIFMLSPVWHVMVEFRTLLMKMALDGPTNDKAKANFELICDVQILLGLVAILPLL